MHIIRKGLESLQNSFLKNLDKKLQEINDMKNYLSLAKDEVEQASSNSNSKSSADVLSILKALLLKGDMSRSFDYLSKDFSVESALNSYTSDLDRAFGYLRDSLGGVFGVVIHGQNE